MKTFKNPFAFYGQTDAEAKTRALMQAGINEKVACNINGYPQAFFIHVEIPKKIVERSVLGDRSFGILERIEHRPMLRIGYNG